MDDYERLRDSMKTAKAVAALDDHNIEIRSGNERLENTDVMGVSPNYAEVRNINVAQGRFINQTDDDHRGQVVFIGADVADRLFATSIRSARWYGRKRTNTRSLALPSVLAVPSGNRKTIS